MKNNKPGCKQSYPEPGFGLFKHCKHYIAYKQTQVSTLYERLKNMGPARAGLAGVDSSALLHELQELIYLIQNVVHKPKSVHKT